MNRRLVRLLPLIMMLLGLLPSAAGAYSYGNANTEELAETFKTVAAKLSADTPDWKGAQAAYEERRDEMKSHFGNGITDELDQSFAAKDVKLVISDMQSALVLNLHRRFEFAEENFTEYTQAKLLLAKARATYETLKPYMTDRLDDNQLKTLDGSFETALGALGNPGLFGAGEKPADKPLFLKTIKQIYDTISPLFPLKGAAATGSSGGSAPELEAEPSAGHAPMEQTTKTNPIVTISVLAGVALAGGLVVWWTRRRR